MTRPWFVLLCGLCVACHHPVAPKCVTPDTTNKNPGVVFVGAVVVGTVPVVCK